MRINATSTTANSIYLDSDDLLTVSFGKQGKYYAFGGKTLTLFIYDQTVNTIVAKFNNFKFKINSVKFSKDEKYLIIADAGGDVRIYATKCFSSC
jgi:WD40 repeat protein